MPAFLLFDSDNDRSAQLRPHAGAPAAYRISVAGYAYRHAQFAYFTAPYTVLRTYAVTVGAADEKESRKQGGGGGTNETTSTARLQSCYVTAKNHPLSPELRGDVEVEYKTPLPLAALGRGAAHDFEAMAAAGARLSIPRCRGKYDPENIV